MKKIYALTLGCPKNLVDTEKLLFVRFGEYRLVTEPEHADIILINTCSFILPAKEEGIDTIFEMVEIAKGSPSPKRIIVTGCMVEQYGAQLQADLPEVELFSDQDMLYYDGRVLTTSPFAYLKIAEGCSRQCAFCTIPSFKGPYRSRQMKDILSEAALLKGKTQELIIVSQDSSNYGMDQGKALLPELLLRLSDLGFPWIRLLYLYPEGINETLLQVMASRENICNYLDIPLQHLSSQVLQNMKRPGNLDSYLKLVEMARQTLPGVSIRSTFILGFPGETDSDFDFFLDGLERLRLNRVGFFGYSDEAEAPSAALTDKVGEDVIEKRLKEAAFLQDEISGELLQGHVGRKLNVLIEGFDEEKGAFWGRSQYEAPEVDGVVWIRASALNAGRFYPVTITHALEHDLEGVL